MAVQDVKRILVVDDDIDYLMQQEMQLKEAGYQVETAESVADAMDKLAAGMPDLAILDLMLEDSDGGFSLAYRIKKNSPQTPVIIISGVAHETGLEFDARTTEERSWIKADLMLAKPVRFEQLKAEIERLLGA